MVLVVRWDEIKDAGLTLDGQESVGSFPALETLERSGECQFVSPVQVSLRLYPAGGMVEVTGQAQVSLLLSCGRCLSDYEVDLVAPVELTVVREVPQVEPEEGEDELELSAEEMGLVHFEGEEIDLHDTIAEHLIVGLPLRPLCQEECKGLCPVCGTDLNRGTCVCSPGGFMNKFAALKDFKVQE